MTTNTKNIKKVLEQIESNITEIKFTMINNQIMIKCSHVDEENKLYELNSPVIITTFDWKKIFSRLYNQTYEPVLWIKSLFLSVKPDHIKQLNIVDNEVSLYFIES